MVCCQPLSLLCKDVRLDDLFGPGEHFIQQQRWIKPTLPVRELDIHTAVDPIGDDNAGISLHFHAEFCDETIRFVYRLPNNSAKY